MLFLTDKLFVVILMPHKTNEYSFYDKRISQLVGVQVGTVGHLSNLRN